MIEELIREDEPLVDVTDLSVRFGSQQVLRDINLSVPAGQTVVMIGESGCGKTTAGNALAQSADDGSVDARFPFHGAHYAAGEARGKGLRV